MRELIDRWSPTVIILFFILKLLELLTKLGFAAKEDGWRKAARVYFRSEHSKFCQAVFNLDIWSDVKTEGHKSVDDAKKHVIRRLVEFLQQYPLTHWQLRWGRVSVKRERKDFIDIVHAEFNKDGSLEYMKPCLDSRFVMFNGIDLDLKRILIQKIIEIYNETKDFDDKKRPIILKKRLDRWVSTQLCLSEEVEKEAKHYIKRVLSSTFICFEELPIDYSEWNNERFDVPDFVKRKHPGFGPLNILCRLSDSYDEADLWFQVSHIIIDGMPMQEVLQDLKEQWGTCRDLKFPSLSYKRKVVPELCSTKDSKSGIYYGSQFMDFQPFLESRKELNEKFANQIEENITVVSMLVWGLAHHHVFNGVKFSVTIDLPACTGRERTVGFMFIRPSVYFDKDKPEKGFLKFQREFSRRLQATKERRSESYKFLQVCAIIPPSMYTFRLMPSALAEFTGTLGITVIKDTDLGIAPLGDTQTDGFLAFGNFGVPTEDCGMAGAVSIKGAKDKVEDYLLAINEVVKDFYEYF